jgi:hypothetical protein
MLENARSNKIVMENAKKFADEVRAVKPVVKAFLFGPHADGTAIDGEANEIDVCFVLKDFGGKSLMDITGDLGKIAWKCGLPADIFPFMEFSLYDGDEFLEEIIERGKDI